MSYNSDIIRRATARLEQQRGERESRQRALRQEIYAAVPELQTIENRLHSGMVRLAATVFDHTSDTDALLEQIRTENVALQERRSLLLLQNGYDVTSLDDKPACPKCGDRGWVGTSMCSCLAALCAQEQIHTLSSMLDLGEQSFETFDLSWYPAEYDEELGMSPRENMTMVEKICQNYAQRFGKYLIHNLFLTGAPGLGKTFLSACIARVVSEGGYSVVYDTAVSVFTHFENAKFGRSEESNEAVVRYLNCDLLILDDLGSELTSPMSQSSLYTIVNVRLTADRHTVISSNLSLEDVRRRYQPMIASRLEGEYRELCFTGKDIRLLRKNEMG